MFFQLNRPNIPAIKKNTHKKQVPISTTILEASMFKKFNNHEKGTTKTSFKSNKRKISIIKGTVF
jgi:predicted transcriptional regulator